MKTFSYDCRKSENKKSIVASYIANELYFIIYSVDQGVVFHGGLN